MLIKKQQEAKRTGDGNMQKGIHYDKTFAATPGQNASRILQAILVRFKWKRKCFDIKQAYCWAKLPDDKLIALKYPKGFERYDEKGNELYIVLRKNLYGVPSAARAWSQERDRFLDKYFNQDHGKGEWSCHKCTMDPSMFYFTRSEFTDSIGNLYPEAGALAVIHTDDCDMIGSDESILNEITQICHDEWEVKEVNPNFMLGVKRTLVDNEDEFSIE